MSVYILKIGNKCICSSCTCVSIIQMLEQSKFLSSRFQSGPGKCNAILTCMYTDFWWLYLPDGYIDDFTLKTKKKHF